MTKQEIMKSVLKRYINRSKGYTKVIIGNDELEITLNTVDALDAWDSIRKGKFDMKNVQPANIDAHVANIRNQLLEYSSEIERIHNESEKTSKFIIYSPETSKKTKDLAYKIYSLKALGI